MLTLVTGVPGTGKTAYCVNELIDVVGDRLLFVDGIKDLSLPHEAVPHIDTWVRKRETESGAQEIEWVAFPPGSLVVIDECQRLFRPRHPSQKVPDAVAGFETHRHAGLDFWLITQDAMLLDSNVRKLIDRHIHIQDSWLGRFTYTWLKEGDPKSRISLAEASRQKYIIPKRAFDKYKSAELHTKRNRPVPWILPVGIAAVLAFAFLVYRVVNSVSGRGETGKEPASQAALPAKPAGQAPAPAMQAKPTPKLSSYDDAYDLIRWLNERGTPRIVSIVRLKKGAVQAEGSIEWLGNNNQRLATLKFSDITGIGWQVYLNTGGTVVMLRNGERTVTVAGNLAHAQMAELTSK